MNENGDRRSSQTVELKIDARPENLVLARLALAGVGATVAAPQDLLAEFKLAVTEACTNAIQHAYPSANGDAEIIVRYTAEPGHLGVEVEDFGIGFEPGVESEIDPIARLEDPDPNGRSNGLGLLIIRELADEMTVTSRDSGTRVAFARSFSSER